MPASTPPKLEKEQTANPRVEPTEYVMAFTAGALLYRESVRIAEMYCSLGKWTAVRYKALDTNVLQSKTKSTAKRVVGEVIGRLRTLTAEQLAIVVDGDTEERKHVLWLGICKRYRFIWDFAVEIVREHYLTLSPELTRSDYNSFFNAKAQWHPELEALSLSTRKRLRQTLFKMLREAALLTKDGVIIPALLSPRVARALVSESADVLSVYPATQAEMRRSATQ